MATATLGTAATNTLTALSGPGSYQTPDGIAVAIVQSDADIATMQQLMKDDLNPAQPINYAMAGWSRAGQLFIPNRGWLKVYPGDFVGVDATGWPILVSRRAAASGSWVHT
jgi:hypothetical protein